MSRYNNFNILRFFAAFFVITGHMHYLTGVTPPVVYGQAISTIGVKILFLLSGYFIALSFISDSSKNHIFKFFIKRIIRIFPPLIFVVISTMLLCSLISTLSFDEYFLNRHLYSYLKNIILLPVYNLPGVFADNPYPVAVNGSLWTMPVELLMYLLVPCLFFVNKFNKYCVFFILIFTCLVYLYCFNSQKTTIIFYGTNWYQALGIMPYFLIGCIYAIYPNLLKLLNLQIASLIIFILACFPISMYGYFINEFCFMFFFSYFIFSFGNSAPPFLVVFFQKFEVSYGMYLWSFPIQQFLVSCFNNKIPFIIYLVLTIFITLFFSFISCVLIEKPCVKLSKFLINKI